MKGFALVLLCALVAVQARHTGLVKSKASLAALGENPWVVHLRIAVSTSGILETCAGTLISERWVLTAASCVVASRFIWIRYGVVDVISPSLVTEASIHIIHGRLGLININRFIESTDNISPAALSSSHDVSSGKICFFGGDRFNGPGSQLKCSEVKHAAPTRYDLGAGLVSDGKLTGVLVERGFVPIHKYLHWIKAETGVRPASAGAETIAAPEEIEAPEDSDAFRVNFVN